MNLDGKLHKLLYFFNQLKLFEMNTFIFNLSLKKHIHI